jgi:hypothetical protein
MLPANRWTGPAVGVVALIAALALQHPYPVGLFHDDGAYAILAGALASGRGLTFLHLPGAPYNTHYPPIYPVVLSLLWRMTGGFPANLPALLAVSAVAVGAIAWGIHELLTRIAGWSNIPSAIVAILASLSFPILLLSGTLLSEPLFLALFIPLVLLGQRTLASRDARHAALFGALCALLILVRTQGIVLPLAVVLLVGARREWKTAGIVAGAAVIPVIAWQLWTSSHTTLLPPALQGSYGSYLGWFVHGLSAPSFLWKTVGINARDTWTLIGERFVPLDLPGFVHVAAVLAIIAMIAGAVRLWKTGSVLVVSIALYIAIVLVWPYTPWRFIYGIWPLVLILVAIGIRPSSMAAENRPRFIAIAVLITGVLGAGWLRQEWSAWRTDAREVPIQVAAQQAIPSVRWIAEHTQRSDVIVTEASELVYLYSGRRAVPLMPFDAVEYGMPRSPAVDARGLQRMLSDVPATYMVALSPAMRAAAALVTQPRLTPVDTLNGLSVFRVSR